MNVKKLNLLFAASLIVIGVCTLILSISSILGIQLHDTATRVLGVANMIALPFLVFSAVKKLRNRV